MRNRISNNSIQIIKSDDEIYINKKREELSYLIGSRYNDLTILDISGYIVNKKTNKKSIVVKCLCNCGVNKEIILNSLKSGNTKSCGCRSKINSIKHNLSSSEEYMAWCEMKRRCLNPNNKAYKNYGGRGITICDEWVNSFETFFNDMSNKPTFEHSLDRINNNGNYCKENCRWATNTEQANNKRTNRRFICKNESLTLTEISKKYNLSITLLRYRLNVNKLTINEAIEKPSRYKQKKI